MARKTKAKAKPKLKEFYVFSECGKPEQGQCYATMAEVESAVSNGEIYLSESSSNQNSRLWRVSILEAFRPVRIKAAFEPVA